MRYDKFFREGTFLHQYMKFMTEVETPSAYDFWCGMWLISNAVGRDIYVSRPRLPVYLNLYIILCADSGVTRKSTGINYASRIINVSARSNDSVISSGRTYPSKLLKLANETSELHGKTHIAIAISELGAVMSRTGYMRDMPVLLTDLYDCPEVRHGGGSMSDKGTVLHNVYTTFLSASTPRWLLTRVNSDIIEGGFTSRCFFIHEESRKRKISWPTIGEVSDDIFVKERAEDLDAFSDRARRVKSIEIHPLALVKYNNWYQRRKDGTSKYTHSFESREQDHVLRVAALLSINDEIWIIQEHHIKRAIQLVEDIKSKGDRLFEMLFNPRTNEGNDNLVAVLERIRDTLVAQETTPIIHSMLLRKLQPHKTTFIARCLDTLEDRKMVRRINHKPATGRPSVYWLGTKLLLEIPLTEIAKQIDGSRV